MAAEKLDFVITKYELTYKNIEFLDSYVPKMLAIYAAFFGLIMVNLDKVTTNLKSVPFLMIFIAVVTVTILVLLNRISQLVIHQKATVRAIEQKVQLEHDLLLCNKALPDDWEKGFSTAKISRWAIAFMSVVTNSVIIYVAYLQ